MLLKFLIKISTFPSFVISNMPLNEDQIKNQTKPIFLPFPWLTTITLLGSSSLYAFSSYFELLTYSAALILSTFVLAFLKASTELKASLIIEKDEIFKEETKDFIFQKQEQETDCDESLLTTSCDETSASEETDESEWSPFGDDPDQDPTREYSDGSISDEESLIELDPKKPILFPITKCGFQQKYWSDCYYSNSMEIYDEDNMIEIDLAVGSIKCPRF